MPNSQKTLTEINTFLPLSEEHGGKKKQVFFVLVSVLLISIAVFSYFRENRTQSRSDESITAQKQESAPSEPEPSRPADRNQNSSAQPPKEQPAPEIRSDNAEDQLSDQSEKNMAVQQDQAASEKQESAQSAAVSFGQTISFAYQSPELSPEARKIIRETADRISQRSGRLILSGTSAEEENTPALSQNRVNNIARAFRETGLGVNVRLFKIYYSGLRLPSDQNRKNSGGKVEIQFVPDKIKTSAASE